MFVRTTSDELPLVWEFMPIRKVETMWSSDDMLGLGENCLYDGRLADVN